ncbi:MAG TPA: glutamate 5-kinase [Paludibacteraceae bacterium]|nr:glutamate 5-kinase [Paludibacteraceae bacterium]
MVLKFKKIAVKIGSNVLTQKDGTLDIPRIEKLVTQIAQLHKAGLEIILISSGAVAAGKSQLKVSKKIDPISARQLFSAVGQVTLMNHYHRLFSEHGIFCGQVLTTKENFGSRRHYLNQKNCMSEMLAHNVIPIVNENDTISVTELMFTDNDELSGLIATMMGMEALIILSNIDGIYNGNPEDKNSEVITTVEANKNLSQYIQTNKSSFGRGGMLTKTTIARKVADEGIHVFIANGKKDNILLDLVNKEKHVICTQFIANRKEVSSVKKWIAHSDGFAKGEVHVNAGARKALTGNKATSVLFVGITEILGEFEKDDIVKIIDENGKQLGVGKTQYDNKKATQLIGKKGQRPLVHYDYLYLD